MICRSCRDAGDLASTFREAPSEESIIKAGFRLRIADLHSGCIFKGGNWCDCQHQLPKGT